MRKKKTVAFWPNSSTPLFFLLLFSLLLLTPLGVLLLQKKQRGSKWVHAGLRSPTPPCAGPTPRSALKCRANAVMGRESNHRCPLGPDKLDRIFSLDIGIFDLNPAPSTRAPTLRPRARHLGDTHGVLCRVNIGFCRCGGGPQ